MLEKIYNECIYWHTLFLSTNFIENYWKLINIYIYKKNKRKKKWKKLRRWVVKKKFKKFKKKLKKKLKLKIKTRKYVFFISNFSKIYSKLTNNAILNNSTITLRTLTNGYLNFFYKNIKIHRTTQYAIRKFAKTTHSKLNKFFNVFYNFTKGALKIFFRNYHKKPYWKLRKSRLLHWNFFTNKTICKRRYKNFLKKTIKMPNATNHSMSQLILSFCRIKISYTSMLQYNNNIIQNLISKNKMSIMLPIFFKKTFYWKKIKKKKAKLWKKAKKWSYLRFKKSLYPWLSKKKTFPAFFKKQGLKSKQFLMGSAQYDSFIRSVYLLNVHNLYYNSEYNLCSSNKLLKLHNFRYKV